MNLKKVFFFIAVWLIIGYSSRVFAQAKVRKLPSTLNHPSYNAYYPYLSADANAIVFVTDNAEDNALAAFYSSRDNADWKEPQLLPKNIYTRLNFLRGFALNADGK